MFKTRGVKGSLNNVRKTALLVWDGFPYSAEEFSANFSWIQNNLCIRMLDLYGLEEDRAVDSWERLLEREDKVADAVIVATQDKVKHRARIKENAKQWWIEGSHGSSRSIRHTRLPHPRWEADGCHWRGLQVLVESTLCTKYFWLTVKWHFQCYHIMSQSNYKKENDEGMRGCRGDAGGLPCAQVDSCYLTIKLIFFQILSSSGEDQGPDWKWRDRQGKNSTYAIFPKFFLHFVLCSQKDSI